MDGNIDFHVPNCSEFRRGYEAFNRNESRGHCYFDAISVVSESWGNSGGMAEGIGILIRCWNRFYTNFDFDSLDNCIRTNLPIINAFRNRNIMSLSNNDSEKIKQIFNQFLDALKRITDNQKSAVSVAKAFGLLAPDFLPIWDSTIAGRYDCLYPFAEAAAPDYVAFCRKMKLMAERVQHCVPDPDDRSLLKRIDEYNFSKYTMQWI